MRSILKDKKGQLGLNLIKTVFVTLLILAVVGIAILLAISSLKNSNIFASGSQEYNNTQLISNNISGGIADFFGNTGTILAILVVVVIISAIAIIIAVVSRFGGQGSQGL